MLRLTLMQRSVVGSAVASAMHQGYISKRQNTCGAYYTARPRGSTAAVPPPAPMHVVPSPTEARVKEFKRFYEAVTRSREATSLPPTPLGHGGSERILNNDFLHESPWQASCVELRERAVKPEQKVLSYGNIDFASLRKQSRRGAGLPHTPAFPSSTHGSYSNVEDLRNKAGGDAAGQQAGPGLDVVHYYETSTREGLAGYQQVAMQVRQGVLPGSCTNFSAEGGFAVWVVPHTEYLDTLSAMGYLPE